MRKESESAQPQANPLFNMTNIYNPEIAKEIEKCISDIHESHKDWLDDNTKYQAIRHSFRNLLTRSKEHRKPTFVVLVGGPVKAGKSTFVNLVANNYVSPTHFLECTIRLSIIHKGERQKITVYRSNNTDNEAEQMDDILDCINGLIEKESVYDINTTEADLTEDNINRYVKGGIKNEDNVVLTSITTLGGPLIQEDVFLVDMPGKRIHNTQICHLLPSPFSPSPIVDNFPRRDSLPPVEGQAYLVKFHRFKMSFLFLSNLIT